MDNLILISIIPLLGGWLLDCLLGDPNTPLHPIVLFGKAISWGEKKLNKGNAQKVKGAFLSISLIILTIVFFVLVIISLIDTSMIAYYVFSTLSVYFFLAGKTLRKEVRDVFKAVNESLDKGRIQVARIVGRDTSTLNEQQIRTAALETLAENLSDGVIAPLFWYGILGLPGMAAYKMINTLDSMIAYRTERYKNFGYIAAIIDDIANYIPARITAVVMLLVSGKLNYLPKVFTNGKQHLSPNSGFPEAAMAYSIDCRFGGPNVYQGELIDKPYIGQHDKKLTSQDMKAAIRINFKSELFMVAVITLIFVIYTLI